MAAAACGPTIEGVLLGVAQDPEKLQKYRDLIKTERKHSLDPTKRVGEGFAELGFTYVNSAVIAMSRRALEEWFDFQERRVLKEITPSGFDTAIFRELMSYTRNPEFAQMQDSDERAEAKLRSGAFYFVRMGFNCERPNRCCGEISFGRISATKAKQYILASHTKKNFFRTKEWQTWEPLPEDATGWNAEDLEILKGMLKGQVRNHLSMLQDGRTTATAIEHSNHEPPVNLSDDSKQISRRLVNDEEESYGWTPATKPEHPPAYFSQPGGYRAADPRGYPSYPPAPMPAPMMAQAVPYFHDGELIGHFIPAHRQSRCGDGCSCHCLPYHPSYADHEVMTTTMHRRLTGHIPSEKRYLTRYGDSSYNSSALVPFAGGYSTAAPPIVGQYHGGMTPRYTGAWQSSAHYQCEHHCCGCH